MIRPLFAVVGLAVAASSALAAPLNLVPAPTDVTGTFVAVSYDASTHLLTASGYTNKVVEAPANTETTINPALPGTWTLTATINNDGTIGNGGVASLLISATYPGPLSSNLLTATTLSQFGFTLNGVGGTLEFVFSNAGGTLNPNNSDIGVVFGDATLVASSFNTSFNNGFLGLSGTGDAFLVPTPAAAAMMGLGGLVAVGRRRR